MVDHAPRGQHVGAEHGEPLGRGARAVGAGRDQDDDVLGADDAVQHLGDGGQLERAWLWTGDVADGDRDALAGTDDVAERWARHRLTDRAARGRPSGSAAATGSGSEGSMTVASAGTSTDMPDDPYARVIRPADPRSGSLSHLRASHATIDEQPRAEHEPGLVRREEQGR